MKITTAAILTATAAVAISAAARDDDWRNWQYQDRDSVQRTFNLAGSDQPKLLVDNLIGYVHVTAAPGREMKVTVQKHAYGRSQAAIDDSKREVKLDLSQQGNYVRLYVDGPFRSHDGGTNYRGEDYYGYRVEYDFDVQVPAESQLTLKTMFGGDIEARGTTGDFDIHGFNGGIDLEDIAGSGSVHTFNGKVKVAFARNPQRATSFKTFNGAMDVYFRPPLNADISMKSFNGGVYADFDATPLPIQANVNGGRIIYSSRNRTTKARAGSGGPLLSFEGFNGTIRLHTK